MRKRSSLAALVAAILVSLTAGCQRPTALAVADRAAIRQVQDEYVKLANAKDFKGLAGLYAEDAVIMPPNQPAIQGRAAIQAFMASTPPSSNFQLEILEVEGRGDLAYSREIASETLNPTGAAPTAVRSKVMAIWGRKPDGTWKVLRDMWNPLPPPEKPAGAPEAAQKKR